MATELNLQFASTYARDSSSFRLLELPAEVLQLVQSDTAPLLSIKGNSTEDAVLCTPDKTYSLRSVALSNTVLVTTSDDETGQRIGVRDQLHEIMEVQPTVPKLHKLSEVLVGVDYDEGEEDLAADKKRSKYTYDQARQEIQASDNELKQGLKERRILILNGCLRPITPAYLSSILELLLNYLISLRLSPQAASVDELLSALADNHEIPRHVSDQVMSWFGTVDTGIWTMNIDSVVREIGMGILRYHKHDPISGPRFMQSWRERVGDSFESSVQLHLLSGSYLSNVSAVGGPSLTYFPSSDLPVEPAARFMELFLARSSWKEDEIKPFLTEIAVNPKEREKLLLKYARAATTPQGVLYTSKVSYNG